MATKKKTKKLAKAKRTASKRATKKIKRPSKLAKKKPAPKKAAPKRKLAGKKPARKVRRRVETVSAINRPQLRFGGQAGDLQGLSNVQSADSESVDELLEEGNAFEADVLSGVERAGDLSEREVHTHEVPEDDVPGEYLDED